MVHVRRGRPGRDQPDDLCVERADADAAVHGPHRCQLRHARVSAGADGVIVSGCHPGDCHYTAGNYRARRRWILFRDLLERSASTCAGSSLAWISAAEGAKWVKTIQSFTDKIKELGPYDAMHRAGGGSRAGHRAASAGPAGFSWISQLPSRKWRQPADPQLVAAVGEALAAARSRRWSAGRAARRCRGPRPSWILSAEAARRDGCAGRHRQSGAAAEEPEAQGSPAARNGGAPRARCSSLNVLAQEAQIDPARIVLFAVARRRKISGRRMDLAAASQRCSRACRRIGPSGFPDATWKALDELMAKPPARTLGVLAEQSAKCIKCYACRGSCPMCGCEQCFTDKNQPQWFPTAADGPGNFSWHLMRAFHLAGRCVGCGACQDACPAGIPLDLLNAAMARSAWKHFSPSRRHRSDGRAVAIGFLPNDKEDFIL